MKIREEGNRTYHECTRAITTYNRHSFRAYLEHLT